MKKNILSLLVLGTLVLASCTKDYTCECKDKEDSLTIKEAKKSAAQALCEGKGYDKITMMGIEVDKVECTLK